MSVRGTTLTQVGSGVDYRDYTRERSASRETRAMWAMWAWIVLFIALMLLADQMARTRHRSTKAWVWITAVVGPLGPLALLMLGNRKNEASCT